MALTLQQIQQTKAYQSLPDDKKQVFKSNYLRNVFTKSSTFQQLPKEKQLQVYHNALFGHALFGQEKDIRAEKFIPQATKALYESLPFGKRVISMLPDGEKIKEILESTPEPTTLAGKAGRFVGEAAAYTPAFEAGGIGGLLGSSLAVGTQAAGEAHSKGASPVEATLVGGISGVTTFAGGKVLQAIPKIPQTMRNTAGRIQNWVVKLPKKAMNYGKNPVEVMTKENVVGNTISDLAENYGKRLDERVIQLKEAAKANPSRIDISDDVNKMIDGEIASVQKSTNPKMKSEVTKELTSLKAELNSRNLKNMSIEEAIDLKRQLAKDFPFNCQAPKTSTANTVPSLIHRIHHGINKAIETVAPEITELNQRVSSLIDISEAVRNRMIIESRNNPIGLIGSLLGIGTAGAAYGGYEKYKGASWGESVAKGMGAALAIKAMSSPAVLTRVAMGLSKLSNVDRINLMKAVPWFKNAFQKAWNDMKVDPAKAEHVKAVFANQFGKVGFEEAKFTQPKQITFQGKPQFEMVGKGETVQPKMYAGAEMQTGKPLREAVSPEMRRKGKDTFLEDLWADLNKRVGSEGGEIKTGFGEQPFKKDDNIINFKIGNKNIKVIKNADNSEVSYLIDKFKDEYPNAPVGTPKIRTTVDKNGNTYKWMAGDAVHSDIELLLHNKYGGEYSQNFNVKTGFGREKMVGKTTKAKESL